jgi:hypothetical protein
MKKLIALFLLAVLLLTACAGSNVYDTVDGPLTVDWEQHRISDGRYSYGFRQEDSQSDERVILTFPDGAEYVCYGLDGSLTTLSGGHPDEGAGYTDIEDLYAAVCHTKPAGPIEFQGFGPYDLIFLPLGLILLGIGIFFIADPESGWQWTVGRFVESGEPSERGLLWTRLEGVSVILFSIYLIADIVGGMFGLF